MSVLRLALAQINPTVGDLAGNSAKIIAQIKKARRRGADLAVFPELAITGYPPEDLVLKPQFISDNLAALDKVRENVSGIAAVIGFVDRDENGVLYNAAAIVSEKKIVDVYHKILLPNYGVFDEVRYFRPGCATPVYSLNSVKIGINICEDIWHREGPAADQACRGAEVIVNINASPYERGKIETRKKILSERSSENGLMIAYLNTVGGQDELVFDGTSMVYDHAGSLIARGGQFREETMIIDLDVAGLRRHRKRCGIGLNGPRPKTIPAASLPKMRSAPMKKTRRMGTEEEVYHALVLGTSDYVRKNGFKGVVIGLSGGVDSSLVAAVAADAIGRENVTGIFMPSRYTSRASKEDAFELAANLGIGIVEVPVDRIFEDYLDELRPEFKGVKPDITEENLQARIRGNLLMAFSNKFGRLVLTTGNKSEMSVGYATLYGDMAGGFAVIKDVPKTLVYDLCRWRNSLKGGAVVPQRVMVKEPTAELRHDQKDTDTLPPYHVLDPVLKAYIEDELTFEEILELGSMVRCPREVIERVISMVDRSEYKRRQAPPGVKITPRAFGRDRRFPITNRYRSY